MTTIDPGADAYTGIDDLSVELADGVLSVTMNRPDSLNSLTAAMLNTLADTLERAATDPRVKVVRLGGAGRGFQLGRGDQRRGPRQPRRGGHACRCARRGQPLPSASIVNLPQPVVAVVQGPAAGVGASLALASDVVLASEKAFFMLAFTKIGLMPDGGASALIAAAVGRIRAMRMALLAERIPAAEAFEWGLVTAVYPADQLEAEVVYGDLHAGVRSGRGAAQDQERDQRRDACRSWRPRWSGRSRASWC